MRCPDCHSNCIPCACDEAREEREALPFTVGALEERVSRLERALVQSLVARDVWERPDLDALCEEIPLPELECVPEPLRRRRGPNFYVKAEHFKVNPVGYAGMVQRGDVVVQDEDGKTLVVLTMPTEDK